MNWKTTLRDAAILLGIILVVVSVRVGSGQTPTHSPSVIPTIRRVTQPDQPLPAGTPGARPAPSPEAWRRFARI
ncbi:MAG TPA: hypothetical protein VJS92_06180 [Candidatus Polarisedimenticolaceae bacterium]|nr:hypothetical protein [Candidatus Polarisedimenticolaceae bacterium]